MLRPMSEDNRSGEGEVGMKELWNEMKAVHASLKRELRDTREELGKRLDVNSRRVEEVRDELKVDVNAVHKRAIESELRLATAVLELTDTVKSLKDTVTAWRAEHRAERDHLREELHREVGGLRTELGDVRTELGDVRTELDGIRTRLDRIDERLSR